MRIGIACYPSYGGSGVVASELSRALARRGHSVHLFSYRVPFRIETGGDDVAFHEVRDPNYPLFEYPSYGMALASEMSSVAEREKLDLLHVHYAYPHSMSALLAKLAVPRLKIITTLHGTDITLVAQDPRFKSLVRMAIEKSDRVTAVSKALRAETEKLFRPRKPIRVIPNFVDLEIYSPGEPLRRSGPRTIIYISNFRAVKRPLDAVRVFELVRRKLPARLVMVGEGPELDATRKLAAERGLVRDVEFAGFLRNVVPILRASDLMLVTSQTESFGLVALEAMACGIPVVGTRCGGIEEVVAHGRCGLLSRVGDIRRLAEDALTVLTDEALADRLGRNGRRIAEEKFDARRVVEQYEDLYRQVLRR